MTPRQSCDDVFLTGEDAAFIRQALCACSGVLAWIRQNGGPLRAALLAQAARDGTAIGHAEYDANLAIDYLDLAPQGRAVPVTGPAAPPLPAELDALRAPDAPALPAQSRTRRARHRPRPTVGPRRGRSASCSPRKSPAATPPPAGCAARPPGSPPARPSPPGGPGESSIPAATQNALATLEWIGRAENLVIAGPSGTGKSHLVEALAHAAIDAGTCASPGSPWKPSPPRSAEPRSTGPSPAPSPGSAAAT